MPPAISTTPLAVNLDSSKMEKFLEIPTVLDNSSTIEGLLQRLAEAEDHQAYQIWDKLLTQFESFCL